MRSNAASHNAIFEEGRGSTRCVRIGDVSFLPVIAEGDNMRRSSIGVAIGQRRVVDTGIWSSNHLRVAVAVDIVGTNRGATRSGGDGGVGISGLQDVVVSATVRASRDVNVSFLVRFVSVAIMARSPSNT